MTAVETPAQELRTLASSALLGSDRAGPGGASAGALLAAACVAGARARAGRVCRVAVREVGECPPDPKPVASSAQASTLERLLSSPDAALIGEWCGRAIAKGVRVPPVLVPTLLEWWARQTVREPEVFEATGATGVWLAGLRTEWRKPVATSEIPGDAESVWQTGTSAERFAVLTSVRRREPARALEMVRTTWAADGAEERRRALAVLGEGVTLADEEFLEAALDDRAKTVRREAARVLTTLPGSQLRARMTERARLMLVIEGAAKKSGGVKISIEPPKSFEKSWERDGIEEQASQGKGQRAFWMEQIVTGMDVAAWGEQSGLQALGVLEAIAGDAFAENVMRAMAASLVACPVQHDAAAWADAVVESLRKRPKQSNELLGAVWSSRPIEQSEAMRLRCVAGVRGAAVWVLLASDDRPWTEAFSARAAAVLHDATPARVDAAEYWTVIDSVARLAHPESAHLFEGVISGLFPQGVTEGIGKSLDRIRLRAQMHREFAP